MECVDGGGEDTNDKPKEQKGDQGSETGARSVDETMSNHSHGDDRNDDDRELKLAIPTSLQDSNAVPDTSDNSHALDPDGLVTVYKKADEENGENNLEQESGKNEKLENLSVDTSGCEQELQSSGDSVVKEDIALSDEAPKDTEKVTHDSEALNDQPPVSPHLTKEEAQQDLTEKDADEEVTEFFQSAQAPGHPKFPGLDNVDLASDDEGHGQESVVKGDVYDDKTDDVVADEEIRPGNSDDYDGCIEGDEHATSSLKDYPIKIGNYKVCRQVGPGVKECIILETGEQVKCFTNSQSSNSILSSCSVIQTEPVSTSSPRPDLISRKGTALSSEAQQELSSVLMNSTTGTDNFEYVSFPDGSTSTIVAADLNLNDADMGMIHEQQGFITRNGIPVLLDNTEDDVKIGIQAEMDRLGKVIQGLQKSGEEDLVDPGMPGSVAEPMVSEEVVGDVLSSGDDGDGGHTHHKDVNLVPVKKSKRKRDKQRFYVLQPDGVGDKDSDDVARMTGITSTAANRKDSNENNNNNSDGNGLDDPMGVTQDADDRHRDVGSLGDVNNSSNRVRQHLTDSSYPNVSGSSPRRSPHTYGSRYYDEMSRPSDHSDEMVERPRVPRGSGFHDNYSRYFSPRLDGRYPRYDDSASLEGSCISTRYSHLDRGQHKASPHTSPKQVSWHEMFKMIEEQHRTQQQQQYLEHQRILQEMQENMKQELSKQQDTLKDRLHKYNEILEELSLARQDGEHDSNSLECSQDESYSDNSRHTNLNGVPISLRYPPPLMKHHGNDHERFEESLYDRTHDQRSPEQDFEPPPRLGDPCVNASQVSVGGGDKQLRGGVYSSPMPLTKARHKTSPKSSSKGCDAISCHSPQNVSCNAATLASENAELRERCHNLEDACHDRQIEIRELTQKMQGLERRAADCSERFETSQTQVASLHSRLEELTDYTKERDGVAADMELKAKASSEALHSSHKREKELTDSLQAAKITIRKLVEKYEIMEKDHQLLKDSHKDQENSLYSTRKELREANNKLSRLELENKQLVHEKELLKHEVIMARSSPTKTSFEDALENVTGQKRTLTTRTRPGSGGGERAYRSVSQERDRNCREVPSTDAESSDCQHSPILRAERELQKLRESMVVNGTQEFAPKLQRKFYGTDVPRPSGGHRGPTISSPGCHTDKNAISLQAPKSSSPRDQKGTRGQTGGRQTAPVGSLRPGKQTSDLDITDRMDVVTDCRKHRKPASKLSTENGLTGEQAVVRVKSGEIISRPAWEDMYTSMAVPAGRMSGGYDTKHGGDVSRAMRETSLRDRLENIENLERKYDDLISEKRKYESALSKVRGQSQRRDKDRLESELDRVDRELGSIRMSLKRFHVLKSSI